MDRKYNLRLDLQFRCNNSVMKFDEFDKNTSDFFIRVTRGNKLIDISKAIVTLVVIKPDNTTEAQFVTIENNNVYCDLKPSMKDIPGKYEAIASITVNGETINTDPTNPIVYEVTENKFLRQLNEEVVSEERFTILTEMISRLSEIELQEISRQEAELSREEAEKLRQEAIEKIKSDIAKLIEDTNSKVDTNLKENSNKVDKLISDTETKIDNYKLEKDAAIQQDLQQYKIDTTQDIDNYKNLKDAEIDKNLEDYKTATTRNIDAYKNLKNTEIDNYKTEKDLEIDTYVASKNKELDIYAAAKNAEINEYKDLKDTLINDKLREVDTTEQKRVDAEQKRSEEHKNREQFLNGFETQVEQIETDVEILKNTPSVPVEIVQQVNKNTKDNKRQDFYINALYNENADGRLSIEGKGNNINLEGSKQGLVEIEKVVGNTFVNLGVSDNFNKNHMVMDGCKFVRNVTSNKQYGQLIIPLDKLSLFKSNGKYKVMVNITKNTLVEDGSGSQRAFELHTYNYSNHAIESSTEGNYSVCFDIGEIGTKECIITMKDFTNPSNPIERGVMHFSSSFYATSGELEGYIIICEYEENQIYPTQPFEGMQSTFEDKLITQNMVDAGEELAENLGKYKVDVKVIGKNKFNIELIKGFIGNDGLLDNNATDKDFRSKDYLSCKPNVNYKSGYYLVNGKKYTSLTIHFFDENYNKIGSKIGYEDIVSPHNTKYLMVSIYSSDIIEGVVITENEDSPNEYEPYFERKTSVYLNSPLLKGDKLTISNGEIVHKHNTVPIQVLLENGFSVSNISASSGVYVQKHNNTSEKPFNAKNYDISYVYSNRFKVVPNAELHNFDNEPCIGLTADGYIRLILSYETLGIIEYNADSISEWLVNNPITLIYPLAEPYCEKITDGKFILEMPNSATLHIDSNIPVSSVKASYTGKLPSVYKLENDISTIEELNVDMVATSFDMDYRLLEVEWALEDAGITGISLTNILNTNKGVKSMALSRYEQAKIMIIGGAYDKEVLTKQLTRYLEKKIITQQEYDELIALMEAKELVTGE